MKHRALNIRPAIRVVERPVALWAVLFFALVFAVAMTWLPIHTSVAQFLYDDMYYYLKVAQNIVNGKGVTFDGVEPTNGFHPLWLMIATATGWLAPAHYVSQSLLMIAALLHVAQGAMLFKICARFAHRAIALTIVALYVFNYRVLAVNLCGLETPLSIFMMMSAVYYVLTKFFDSNDNLGQPLAWALLGVWLSISVLARFDLLLLMVVMLAFIVVRSMAWDWRLCQALPLGFARLLAGDRPLNTLSPTPSSRRVVKGLFSYVVVFGLLMMVWFIWSYEWTGTLLPQSGKAISVILQDRVVTVHDIIFSSLWWLTDTSNALNMWPVALPTVMTNVAGLLPIVSLALMIVANVLWNTTLSFTRKMFLLMLGIYAMGHLVYFCVNVRAEVRYLLPLVVVFWIHAAAFAQWIYEAGFKRGKRLLQWLAVVMAINMVLAGWSAWSQQQGATRTHSEHSNLLNMALWMSEHLPKDAVIGSWNGGILSYFSNLPLINLDGVINQTVIDYNKRKALPDYLALRRVEFLVDVESQMTGYMKKFGFPDNWREDYREVYRQGDVVLFQLQRKTPAGS